MKFKILFLIIFFPLLTFAQNSEIDIRLENCLNNNISTSDQRKCIYDAEIS